MDGAASVITVVGLALHSTQIVYKTVSGIKHAPRTLQHLTSNLHNLSNVLQQLNGFGDDLQLASELPQLVAGCAKYMREFEAKVSKLCSPKDKKVARLWKNVKATLQEDELDRMSTLLQQHFAVLSLQISIIKGKRLERIENCSNRQATLSATHTTILQSTKSDVDQVNRALGNLQTTSQTSAQTVTNAIDAVGEKVLNAANMSAEQCATLSTRLESILELWKRLDLSEISQQREAKPASREAGETDEQLPGPSDNCLGEALDRLSELVNEKEQTISSTEAESIIEDVDELLAYLLKAEGNHKLHDDRKRKKRAYDEGDDIDVQDAQCKHDLKRMKRILNASDRIALKEKGEGERVFDKRLCFKTTCRVRSSSNGMFTIKARRGILTRATSHNDITDISADETSGSFDVSVIYVPRSPSKAHIAFALSQRTFFEGCSLKTPVLAVSAMIPDDSEVFRVIKNGELDRLMKMLTLRQASLTDRDTKGRCLLNIVAINDRADLATIHALHLCCEEFYYDEHTGLWKDYDDLDSLAKVNECRQQLLEVGADPTISTPNTRSPARVIFSRSRKVIKDYSHSEQRSDPDKDALATLLNHGFEFLASVVDSCHIVNIVIAEQGWTLAGVEFLLQLSGSKLPTQNLTCALGNAIHGSFDADESEWLQVLILLIENGADMTGPGHWVSGVACNPRTWYKMRDMESHEMYDGHNDSILNQDLRLRRIWAKGLAACGYDAEEFISQSKRFEELSETDDEGSEDEALLMPDEELISTAEYNSRSTRFEEMWDTDDEECEEQKDRISDEDNISTAEEPVQPPDLNEEAFDGANGSGANDTSQLSGPIPYNSSDWARLEEDTLIWQD